MKLKKLPARSFEALEKRLRRNGRVLIISGPGIGDSYLATPIISSLKARFPDIEVSYLVRDGRESFFKYVSHAKEVLSFDYRSTIGSYLRMIGELLRKYDLAISTGTSDRFTLSTFYAAPYRIGIVPNAKISNLWKRFLLQGYVEADFGINTLVQNLRLVDVLGLDRVYQPILPDKPSEQSSLASTLPFCADAENYAVVHCFASGDFKSWLPEKWKVVVADLVSRGLKVVLTGGPGAAEVAALEELAAAGPEEVVVTAGKLDFAEIVELLNGASLSVSIDTCVSHLSAACGIPTIVLFGPTKVEKWSPWPYQFTSESPQYIKTDNSMYCDNVYLVKGRCSCPGVPTRCSHKQKGYSLCMHGIKADAVLQQIDFVLSSAMIKSKA